MLSLTQILRGIHLAEFGLQSKFLLWPTILMLQVLAWWQNIKWAFLSCGMSVVAGISDPFGLYLKRKKKEEEEERRTDMFILIDRGRFWKPGCARDKAIRNRSALRNFHIDANRRKNVLPRNDFPLPSVGIFYVSDFVFGHPESEFLDMVWIN